MITTRGTVFLMHLRNKNVLVVVNRWSLKRRVTITAVHLWCSSKLPGGPYRVHIFWSEYLRTH